MVYSVLMSLTYHSALLALLCTSFTSLFAVSLTASSCCQSLPVITTFCLFILPSCLSCTSKIMQSNTIPRVDRILYKSHFIRALLSPRVFATHCIDLIKGVWPYLHLYQDSPGRLHSHPRPRCKLFLVNFTALFHVSLFTSTFC